MITVGGPDWASKRIKSLLSAGALALLAVIAVFAVGWWSAASGQNTVDLSITDPGGDASGVDLDLSSFANAAAALSGESALKLEWPGASDLGETVLSNASVSVTPATESIVFAGGLDLDGQSLNGIVILDWEDGETTPTVSLGLDGELDLVALNPNWQLEGSAFVIDGFAAISSGDQDLAGVGGASDFYGARETLVPGLEIEGDIAIDRLFPGLGPNATTMITISASLEADIAALLTDAEYAEETTVRFDGTIAASQLSIAGAEGLSATEFSVSLTLSGNGDAQEFEASATGSITIDDDAVASNAVTFTVTAETDGTDVFLSGGLADGTTWDNPLGVSSLTVSEVSFSLDAPAGETPTLTLTASATLGGVGVQASTVINDEIAVELSVGQINVGELVRVFGGLGVSGDVNSLDPNGELLDLMIEPTTINLRTEAGNVFGAVTTGITFRGNTATILLAGGTGPGDGLLAAVTVPQLTVADLAPTVPADLGNIQLPSGGFILSTAALPKADAGEIEDAYLSNLYCGSEVDVDDCDYSVPSGLSLAAQINLDEGIRETLSALVPLGDGPVRVEGTLPVFGEGELNLTLELPPIEPDPTSDVGQWLVEARLSISFTVAGGDLAVKLTGDFDTVWEDETEPAITDDDHPLYDRFAGRRLDEVTFTIDAELSLGRSGASVTIGAMAGPWDTPFGIDWVDLNGLRLEVTITVLPRVSVQVGIGASATILPNGPTFEAAFAISVTAAPPVPIVEAGFRMFADAITLRDVAGIATSMGANVDPTALPDASLRNVEFAFGTIDAPNLCLQRGLVIAADVYVDSPMTSQGPGEPVDRGVCSDTSISPAEGVASCAADESCLAHLRLAVGEDGIQASASINNLSFGADVNGNNPAVSVNSASIALALTADEQYFEIAGDVEVRGFARVQGSLRIEPTGFAFNLETESDDDSTLVTISGRFGLNTDVAGFEVELDIFVRSEGLNDAFAAAEDVRQFVESAFTLEPPNTTYSLRCVELNVDLTIGGTSNILSGSAAVAVHFSATDEVTGFEDGRIWDVSWDFDAPVTNNVANLATQLGGATRTDEVGCSIAPIPLNYSVGGVQYVGQFFTGQTIEPLTVDIDQPISVNLVYAALDFSRLHIEIEAEGTPFFVRNEQFTSGTPINVASQTSFGTPGFYTIRSVIRQGSADGAILATQEVPVRVRSTEVLDYSATTLGQVQEGQTISLGASWRNPDINIGGFTSVQSQWVYSIESASNAGNVFEPVDSSALGVETSDQITIDVPDRCVCRIFVDHFVTVNNETVAGSTRVIDVVADPALIEVVIGDSAAFDVGQGESGTLTVTQQDSTLFVSFSDTNPDFTPDAYELTVEGPESTTIVTGDFSLIGVELDDFANATGEPVNLNLSVRHVDANQSFTPLPIRQEVVFAPDNTQPSRAANVSLDLLPATLTGSTLAPIATDDSPNPFGSLDCGAIWFRFTAPGDVVDVSTVGSSTRRPRVDGGTGQELAIAVYDTTNNALIFEIAPDGNRGVTNSPQSFSLDVIPQRPYLIAVAASDMPADCSTDETVSGPVVLRLEASGVPPIADDGWILARPGTDLFADDDFILSQFDFEGTGVSADIGVATVDISPNNGSTSNDERALAATGFGECFSTDLEQTLWWSDPINSAPEGQLSFSVFDAPTGDTPYEVAAFREETDGSFTLLDCAESTGLPYPTATFEPEAGRDHFFLIDTGVAQPPGTPVVPGLIRAHSGPLDAQEIELSTTPTVVRNAGSFVRRSPDLSCTFLGNTDPSDQFHRWLQWEALSGAPVDISVTNGADAALVVYERNGDDVDVVGCSDLPGSRPEVVRLSPLAGQTYFILVASAREEFGFSNQDTTFDVAITNRADLSVNELIEPGEFPLRTQMTNVNATSENRVGSCLGGDFASVHHRFITPGDPDAPGARNFDLDIDTFGSDFDTTLVVGNFAEEVGCNDDAEPGVNLQSYVPVDDFRGTLFIQVDGFNGLTGDVQLNVTTRGDDWRNAVEVPGLNDGSTLDTTFASVEPNERRGECHANGDALNASVWWKFTPDVGGIFNAVATGFDTQVTVFTTDANGEPGNIVGCGEDGLGLQAVAQFVGVAGEEYFVQVDGRQDAVGSATLFVQQTVTGLDCGGLTPTILWGPGAVATEGDDVILGTSGTDVINSLGGDDVICTLQGDDTVNSGAGNDRVFAGPGADVLIGSTGNDQLFGEDGDDTINGGPDNDSIFAGPGEDTVFGLGGADNIDGGPDDDQIVAGNGDDTVNGGDGADLLNGGPGSDTVNGDAGDDEIFGQGGDDTLNGGDDDDLVVGVDGADTINGGSGNDVVNGGANDDIVNGGPDDDIVFGLTGNDTVDGDGGNDFVFGQLGDDTIDGGTGNDQLFGNQGDDTISDPSGTNVINGGPDDDTITGGDGDDQIFGDGDVNQAGDDIIDGGLGQDLIIGFAGNDTITANDGIADTVNGGPGTDTCTTDTGIDTVFLCEP